MNGYHANEKADKALHEIDELKEKVEQLKEDVDWLKKVLSRFNHVGNG